MFLHHARVFATEPSADVCLSDETRHQVAYFEFALLFACWEVRKVASLFFFCGFRFKIFLELICIWMFLVFGLICSPPAFELILFCLQNWGLKLLETKERNVKKNQKKRGFKSKSGHEERERVKESLVFYRSFKSDSFSGRSLSWNGDIRRPRHLCVWPTYKTASLLLLQSLSRPLLPLLHGITGGWAARCKK